MCIKFEFKWFQLVTNKSVKLAGVNAYCFIFELKFEQKQMGNLPAKFENDAPKPVSLSLHAKQINKERDKWTVW